MAGFSDTFTGTNADPWSATYWQNSGGTVEIQTNQGRITASGGAYANSHVDSIEQGVTDGELLYSYNLDSTSEAYFVSWFRADDAGWQGNGEKTNGYAFEVDPLNGGLYGYKLVAGSRTSISTQSFPAIQTTAKRWVRIRWEGTALKYRNWADGAGEPGTWDVEVTDSSLTAAAGIAFSHYNGSAGATRYVNIDDLVLTDLAAPAGLATRPLVVSQAVRRASTH